MAIIATWNPADKSGSITLSNANLTAAGIGANASVRGNIGYHTGKKYFEVSATQAGGSIGAGVANSSFPIADTLINSSAWGLRNNNAVYKGGSQSTDGPNIVANSRMMFAIDFDENKFWAGVGGTWLYSGDPSTGANPTATTISGTLYPLGSAYYSADKITAHFTPASFAYSIPDGFTPWGLPYTIEINATVKVGSATYSNASVYLYEANNVDSLVKFTPDENGACTLTNLSNDTTYILVAHDLSEEYEPVGWSITTGSQDESFDITLDFLRGATVVDPVYTADLVLTSPYVDPTGNLLVLRSQPDIAPVTGILAALEQRDTMTGDGALRRPVDPITGVLVAVSPSDGAAFVGDRSQRVTGALDATNRDDTATASGDGYTGLGVRRGILAVVSSPDTADVTALWTMKWRGTLGVTEQPDKAQGAGDFLAYQGPGYLMAVSPSDSASFVGASLYDVSGTLEVTGTFDVSTFTVISNTQIEESSSDTALVYEDLIGDLLLESLVDRCYAMDVLDYDRGMVFLDVVQAADTLSSALWLAPVVVDNVVVQESVSVQYGVAAADSLVATDVLRGESPFVVEDTLRVADILSSYALVNGTLADEVWAGDACSVVYAVVTLADVGTVSETLSDSARLQADVVDEATLIDLLQAAISITQQDYDEVVAADAVVSSVLVASEDVLTLTETVASWVSQSAALAADVGVGTDALTGWITVYAPVLAESVAGEDVLTSTLSLHLAGVLADTALIGDALFDAAQTVLVTNAETGAVSTYVFTPALRGMADYHGVLYLAGPDGLYALDAAQDEDGVVVWTLRTGFSDLGTDRLKRIQDINVQARTEGDTTFQVVSDRYGQKQEWNYRMSPLTHYSYRDGVVKPGRGIQSVYYALGLQGTGPAEIDQLRVVVEPLSRRR